MTDDELRKLAALAASLCGCYGGITKQQAEHMTINSFRKYPKKFFIDTLKIGMELHGFGNKTAEFEEKINDPKFDPLFKPGSDDLIPPEEEILDPTDVPDNVVIEKEGEEGV